MIPTLVDRSSAGVLNIDGLRALAMAAPGRFLINGLIKEKSVNILVGNSTIGKTPLMVTFGIAVASGTDVFGLSTVQGNVLYADLESTPEEFITRLEQISKMAGLPEVPKNFDVWSPHWDTANASTNYFDALLKKVEAKHYSLVLIDPLRNFCPDMEQHADKAGAVWNTLRKLGQKLGTAFCFVHHLRKEQAEQGRLIDDPHRWFQNAAGSHALINGADLRLGAETEKHDTDELTLAGLRRGAGPIPPIHLVRDHDPDGEVLGYRRVIGLDRLTEEQRTALNKLSPVFRFVDVQHVLTTKGASAVAGFLKALVTHGIAVKLDGRQGYKKLVPIAGVSGGLALAA